MVAGCLVSEERIRRRVKLWEMFIKTAKVHNHFRSISDSSDLKRNKQLSSTDGVYQWNE